MRGMILALSAGAALLPLPAFAQDEAPAEETGLARAAEEMSDPARQAQAAIMAEVVMTALLEVPVGKLLQSAATIAGEDPDEIDPDITLREVAGPEAERAPRQFAAAMPRMMEAAGALAGAFGTMLPELRRIGEDIARELPEVAD